MEQANDELHECQHRQQTAHNFAIPYLEVKSQTQSSTAIRTRKRWLRSFRQSFTVEHVRFT